MSEKQLKNIKHKILDYKRFSFIFLFIGAFLNIGSALPFEGKSVFKTNAMLLSSFVFLIISLLFYWGLKRAKRQYEENL